MGSPGKPRRFKLTAPDPNEDELQASIADLLNAILHPDEAQWLHVPAGGYVLTPAARARLYRLGLRAGWPDILICFYAKTLWLEVKTRTGSTTPVQKRKHEQLQALRHPVVVVRCIEDVIAALEAYRVPFRKTRLAESYHGKVVGDPTETAAAGIPQVAP